MANTFYKVTLGRLTEQKMRNNFFLKADVTPMPIGFSEPMWNLLTLAFYSRIPLEKKKEIKDCPVAWPEQERGHYEVKKRLNEAKKHNTHTRRTSL